MKVALTAEMKAALMAVLLVVSKASWTEFLPVALKAETKVALMAVL